MPVPDPAAPMLLDALRRVAVQEESVTAARMVVFLFALGAAKAWDSRRPRLAWSVLTLGGAAALSYWLIQIVTPFGLGSDPGLTREWAQAAVNATTRTLDMGFVQGTVAEPSLPATLAGLGLPISMVQALPQLRVLLWLGLVAVLPLWAIRDRSTARFAACLLIGGGLWPGFAPCDWLLQNPSGSFGAGVAAILLGAMARARWPTRRLRRIRFGLAGLVIAVGVVAPAPLLLLGATAIVASLLRALIREQSDSAGKARRVEAFVLLAVFGGGGLLWWNPPRTVSAFVKARNQDVALRLPMDWIKRNVGAEDVVMTSPEYSASLSALTGRRVLLPPLSDGGRGASPPEPARRARLYSSTLSGEPVSRLADHFGATHLFLGPGEVEPATPGPRGSQDEPRMALTLVYRDVKDFRIFRLTKK